MGLSGKLKLKGHLKVGEQLLFQTKFILMRFKAAERIKSHWSLMVRLENKSFSLKIMLFISSIVEVISLDSGFSLTR